MCPFTSLKIHYVRKTFYIKVAGLKLMMQHAVHQYCIEVAGFKIFNYVTFKILVK
jgi:hypothetical protein